MSAPNDGPTVNLRNTTSTEAPPSQEAAADAAGAESQSAAVLSSKSAANQPPGEQLPLLSKPSGTLARSLPDWDLEPPGFLVRRGEDT